MLEDTINNIKARFILDSRGNPTIEADVYLTSGMIGRASVPSGASTGEKEALELRDPQSDWHGQGVNQAVSNIHKIIQPKLIGESPFNIKHIDQILLALDGTENKSNIGANAMLAVSLANVQAGANSKQIALFEYIYRHIHPNYFSCPQYSMPIPMMNILNGGSHADNNVDIQEFMIMPIGFSNYTEALKAGTEIFHSLKTILKKHGFNTSIGDEGGFAPMLNNNEEAIEFILEAIITSNYKPGEEIFLALDVAASEFYDSKKNKYLLEKKQITPLELIDYYQHLCSKYPIVSIEDGLDQNDWEAWRVLNTLLGNKIQIVGDDLTVTNSKFLQQAIRCEAINAILIKLNQIGTFTETLETIQLAQKHNLGTIISHRSGETENTFIADLAVATGAGQIKTGSLCRTDRTAKYNQLLRISEDCISKQGKLLYGTKDDLGCQKRNK